MVQLLTLDNKIEQVPSGIYAHNCLPVCTGTADMPLCNSTGHLH